MSNKNYIFYVIILCVILCILAYCLKSKKITPEKNLPKVVLYYIDACKYCTEFKPIWDKLSNKENAIYIKVDCDKFPNIAKMNNIGRFPTVHLIKNDQIAIEYTGDFTLDSVNKFIQDNS